MASAQNKKIVLVHDWLIGGGAEKVIESLHKMYPDAPIYTSYCTDEWRKRLDNKVVTGYLQKWPFSKLRKYLPLLRQWWFARLDLSEFDLVIATTGNGEAKFVKAANGTVVCYCHTPPHFFWRKYDEYLKNPGFGAFDWLARFGLKLLVKPLRKRDYEAAQKVDYILGNSTHITRDIKKYYDRVADKMFPPVDVEGFSNIKLDRPREPRFILWARHVPDKRIDLAIGACNELQLPLTVIGGGPDTPRLKSMAGNTITFVGRVSDERLKSLAKTASGFIFTSEEDFGIAPVEALAAGLPVIAYKSGGALDYVIPNKTGVFFEEQTINSLVEALQKFSPTQFSTAEIKRFAQAFSEAEFEKRFRDYITSVLDKG